MASPEWATQLEELDIAEGVGFTRADIPTIRGLLLQLPAADRPLFFTGDAQAICHSLLTLLPGTFTA